MYRSVRISVFLSVAALVVLTGCRTYGGYETEPKTYEALKNTVNDFEKDLERAKASLKLLEEAATERDTLQALAERFRGLITEHEALLETQRDRIERLEPHGSYRNLHAAFGATVTEERVLQTKYQQTIQNVRALVRGEVETAPSGRSLAKRYTVRPIGFPDGSDRERISMEEALGEMAE